MFNNFADEKPIVNFNLENIVMPINVKELERMLRLSDYDEDETQFLVNGFTNGFDIGYEGPTERANLSNNIPFREGVGDANELWEKLMKEVKEKRYVGPFKNIPFDNFIQSPIRLVPKGEDKTWQIFHLSYNFKNGNKLLNHHTPPEKCTVKYRDVDAAVSLKLKKKLGLNPLRYAKTDAKSAFRMLPLSPSSFAWLVMKAKDPRTGETFFFVNKCLPFRVSISCSHYQRFSNALKHIFEFIWRKQEGFDKLNPKQQTELIEFVTNYLDDFLFIVETANKCNRMVGCFLRMCTKLGVPISEEKTEWGSARITFLGILLDGDKLILTVPEDKRLKAKNMIQLIISKRKSTVKELEKLARYLNFLKKQ